jgi:serine phosphatase RsbU (regulator of sigma subunit)
MQTQSIHGPNPGRFDLRATAAAYSVETRSPLEEHLRGGDVFDAYHRSDGSSTIFLADVSSKGAFGIARAEMLRRAFRGSANKECSPASIMTALNAVPFTGPDRYRSGTFATVFIATLRRSTQAISYASAGHDTALILKGRTHRHLAPTGPIVGVIREANYTDCVVAFGSTDLLLIATDGFTECRSHSDHRLQFGTTGIIRTLATKAYQSHASASSAIALGADVFTADRYRDDATLAVIARTKAAEPTTFRA